MSNESTSTPRYNRKKKLEFLQRLVLIITTFSMLIVMATLAANFILLWNDKIPMTNETVTTITTFGGILSAAGVTVYGAVAGFRDNSKNKWGVTHGEQGIPYNSPKGNVLPVVDSTDHG